MEIAKTILAQIKAIDPRAMMAWGAKNLVAKKDGLQFQTSGLTPFKGYVEITLDASKDLYKIRFFKLRKLEIKVMKEVEDVFAEDLVNIIDGVVG